MNWKEEFIKLLEAGTFETASDIDDYADEHNLPVTEGQRRELRKKGYTDERIDKTSKGQATSVLSQVPNPPSNEQYRDFLKDRKTAEYKEKLFERANDFR